MKQSLKKPSESAGSLELGKVLGQQVAFNLVAGRCSAAEAAAIRRIRRERLYEASNLSWQEFCPRQLGMSRTQADRVIGWLEEFGPEYFELTQLSRVPADEYRAIASAVKEGHIHWQSEAIALIPENRERVAAAIAALRQTTKPAAAPALPAPAPAAANPHAEAIVAMERRADALVADWAVMVDRRCGFASPDRQAMKNSIGRTRKRLELLEQKVWLTPAPRRTV